MIKNALLLLLVTGIVSSLAAQTPPTPQNAWSRSYHDGEKLTYHMKGVNEHWRYEIQADGEVRKDAGGKYFEEYRWSNLVSNGAATPLAPASEQFRQRLSLAPDYLPSFPDLRNVVPIIGPITDMLTFYSDLWLANRLGKLAHAGDHFYFKRGTPNSWADGTYVLTGEDSIDFDMTLKSVSPSDKTAVLLVRHVPPEKPEVRLPAGWMREPVAGTPNNWVEVKKGQNGSYIAAVGKETFDVTMRVSLVDGKILSGSIENPVETIERECTDATLSKCGEPRRRSILRKIDLSLVPLAQTK